MPGYEPFLLCDLQVQTRWSGGVNTVREVVDAYGRSGRFDVIAIADQVLPDRRSGLRIGRRGFGGRGQMGLRAEQVPEYLDEVSAEVARAEEQYGLLVVPGLELVRAGLTGRLGAGPLALGVSRWVRPNGSIDDVLADVVAQGGVGLRTSPQWPTRPTLGTYAWKCLVAADRNWSSVRQALTTEQALARTLVSPVTAVA